MKQRRSKKCVVFAGCKKPTLMLRWLRFKFSLFLLNRRIRELPRLVAKHTNRYEGQGHVFVIPYEAAQY